jgi:hypothetical protein
MDGAGPAAHPPRLQPHSLLAHCGALQRQQRRQALWGHAPLQKEEQAGQGEAGAGGMQHGEGGVGVGMYCTERQQAVALGVGAGQ